MQISPSHVFAVGQIVIPNDTSEFQKELEREHWCDLHDERNMTIEFLVFRMFYSIGVGLKMSGLFNGRVLFWPVSTLARI